MAAFYLAENRRYLGYDRGLRTGPYQFTSPAQICALRFPYQDGLLVWCGIHSGRTTASRCIPAAA
jgi:hypothetical protein